jgi:hypothetical protein
MQKMLFQSQGVVSPFVQKMPSFLDRCYIESITQVPRQLLAGFTLSNPFADRQTPTNALENIHIQTLNH